MLTETERLERRRASCRKYDAKNRENRLIRGRNNMKKSYAADPEKYKKRSKEYFAKLKASFLRDETGRKKPFIRAAKLRAKEKGVPFSITEDDFYLPIYCPLLGTELDYAMGKGYRPNQASLDRKNPELGYVPGNVWVISRKANTMKNNATQEELQKFTMNLRMLGMVV